MHYLIEIKARLANFWAGRQHQAAFRLRRYVTADNTRSSGCYSWTAAELRAMAKAEKLAMVARKVGAA